MWNHGAGHRRGTHVLQPFVLKAQEKLVRQAKLKGDDRHVRVAALERCGPLTSERGYRTLRGCARAVVAKSLS